MKSPHLMSPQERRDTVEQWRENAEFLAQMNAQLARHNPRTYQPLADGWRREANRLQEVLRR